MCQPWTAVSGRPSRLNQPRWARNTSSGRSWWQHKVSQCDNWTKKCILLPLSMPFPGIQIVSEMRLHKSSVLPIDVSRLMIALTLFKQASQSANVESKTVHLKHKNHCQPIYSASKVVRAHSTTCPASRSLFMALPEDA